MMIHTKANYLIIVGMRKLSPFVPTGSLLTRSSPAGPRAHISASPFLGRMLSGRSLTYVRARGGGTSPAPLALPGAKIGLRCV